MFSSELEDFIGWVVWGKGAAASAPAQPGVYVFRVAASRTPIGRLNGKSDIIYVGSTPKGGSIRARLNNHVKARRDEKDAGWSIDRVVKKGVPLEVGWRTFAAADDAADCESILLSKYQHDHLELPPLNNQMPQKTDRHNEKLVLRALNQLPVEEVAEKLSGLDPNKLAQVKPKFHGIWTEFY